MLLTPVLGLLRVSNANFQCRLCHDGLAENAGPVVRVIPSHVKDSSLVFHEIPDGEVVN